MPIDAGAQPLHKRDPFYPLPMHQLILGIYTVEDVIYMHAYLLGVPGVVFKPQHGALPSTADVVNAFERAAGPDLGIQQVKALITLTHPTKQWARASYGIDL
jgi:hypothetical protein